MGPEPVPRLTTLGHDGLRFDVHDAGPADGEVVVLLHGFPQTSTSWAGVAPLLHAANLRTIALDQRGYSPGARPRGRAAYTLGRLVGDVAALIEEVGGPVHVVGHDWGAAVAWSLAASRPELVRTLTAVSVPHPRAFREAMKGRDQRRRSRYMAFFQLPLVPERVLAGRGGDRFLARSGMGADALERYRSEIVAGGALAPALGWYRALPLSRGQGLGRRVRVPTTYVWSNGDGALGRTGAELTAAYVVDTDYRFVEIGGSHWIPDDQPALLAEHVLARVR